ncbi:MAG: cyclase family protein [Herbinix sp.]|jgi:arylformamidase|nr:cyclase family protein [Herbinix sp.]
MKIYDITQELFSGMVYPGDFAPTYDRVSDMKKGDAYNLTNLSMGAHNATHVDAPFHFCEDGKTIENMELSRCIGPCSVIELQGLSQDALRKTLVSCQKRLLIKGSTEITLEMAKLFNEYNMVLIGVETQSVGPEGEPMQVHQELLGMEVVLLEGIRLDEVIPGDYFLSAAPIKLGGCDGAPCRAILLEFDKTSTCICQVL